MKNPVTPRNEERKLRDGDFIVSRTDLKGRITYANRIFMQIADYHEKQLLGIQHNIIRHPDMPRAAFKFVWDKLQAGEEVFAYVKNLARDGAYYWVFANLTPDRDEQGNVTGYYSVRRKPRENALAVIEPIYREMLRIESQHATRDQMEYSTAYLVDALTQMGKSYEEFILEI
jgi:PAS domain S-box-containing protein